VGAASIELKNLAHLDVAHPGASRGLPKNREPPKIDNH
jgi:hypothetical protein